MDELKEIPPHVQKVIEHFEREGNTWFVDLIYEALSSPPPTMEQVKAAIAQVEIDYIKKQIQTLSYEQRREGKNHIEAMMKHRKRLRELEGTGLDGQ